MIKLKKFFSIITQLKKEKFMQIIIANIRDLIKLMQKGEKILIICISEKKSDLLKFILDIY